jgi:hypothetical protein
MPARFGYLLLQLGNGLKQRGRRRDFHYAKLADGDPEFFQDTF